MKSKSAISYVGLLGVFTAILGLFPIANAQASGEDIFAVHVTGTTCVRAGYFATPIKAGSACTLALTNTRGNSLGRVRYWVQYKNTDGSGTWFSYRQIRRWSSRKTNSIEKIRFVVNQGRTYRVVGDYNSNGIPDLYSNEVSISVK